MKKLLSEVVADINTAPKVYKISEVSELLKCNERAVKHHLYEACDLRYFKIGREVRIREEDLQELIRNKTAFCKTIYEQEVLP
ncbi:helix-turn-helix domain-containing protein [bacterium]|nr:helix-turn-helix domain-containing protein [bacterium]